MVVKKVILYMILLLTNLLAQESLYLIDTLVGKGNGLDERLYYAKGLGDINGDGFSDFVVDSGDSTRIYFGNSEFELKADYSFTGRKLFFPLSDINNDGYDDFILGNNFYYGSALFDTSNAIPFDFPHCFRQSISRKVGNIGDVNGDGYKDFVVSSSYNWCNGYSFVWLYLGGDTVKTEPFVTFYSSPFIEGNSEGSFGTAVTGIGDVNNDGYDDILISDPMYVVDTTARNTGRVLLYYGGEQMDNIADSILTHENGIWFGVDMKNLGDINGDEISDFVITSNDSVKIFFGLNGDKISFTNYGGSIYTQKVSGGDINNDGYNDLLIGNQERTINDEWIGNVSCYLGASVFDTVVDYYSLSEKIYTSYANYLDFIGDYNGDGYDDFFLLQKVFLIMMKK